MGHKPVEPCHIIIIIIINGFFKVHFNSLPSSTPGTYQIRPFIHNLRLIFRGTLYLPQLPFNPFRLTHLI
jgi:hypothetical protein